MPHDLNVVLVEPEIPNNTGSIGRLCLATGSRLHLIKPLGFEITDTQLKRAGLDYWQYLDVTVHENWEALISALPPGAPLIFFSKKAEKTIFEHRFEKGSYLFFGKETTGLGESLRITHADRTFRIPQYDDRVRSLNLANAVSIVVYEAIRQLGP
ncbi:MAG: tRNA (uridine(34)/cytosine(34)/5-carboxymethylaminomethyluridine(34)-2'-O)-methyltransferase TrmL [Nitrospinae bacterium CG11_big_fil_rev_8_21_14_0_20_56_8]|nr:MAG: tRNA (uridine(34)/cytosine(34)/5-carboxymethylaminomethyluridine(34)-2'-O)-methyltransferase TrmL [Nitrospinae bacterium CG11_big_fil_rev_8_21_14_0_20_56_8]